MCFPSSLHRSLEEVFFFLLPSIIWLLCGSMLLCRLSASSNVVFSHCVKLTASGEEGQWNLLLIATRVILTFIRKLLPSFNETLVFEVIFSPMKKQKFRFHLIIKLDGLGYASFHLIMHQLTIYSEACDNYVILTFFSVLALNLFFDSITRPWSFPFFLFVFHESAPAS